MEDFGLPSLIFLSDNNDFLNKNYGEMQLLSTCCHHNPQLKEPTQIINICPGCDKRFKNNYENCFTTSLWELLATNNSFIFPNYQNQKMSITDACPTRNQEQIHKSIRILLQKMIINLIEPKNTGTKSTCCGDSFYGLISTDKVKEQMQKRAAEMPVDDVIVYCVSCINSMLIGGKKPRYLIDLLFDETSEPQIIEPDLWHSALDKYIELH